MEFILTLDASVINMDAAEFEKKRKMQEHMKQMGNPQDRYDEGVAEILAYYRKRRKEDEKERKEAVANKRRSNKKV